MAISTITPKNTLSPLIMLLVPILGLMLYFASLDDEIINEGQQVTIENAQVTAEGGESTVWTAATPSHAARFFAYRPVLAQLLRWEYKVWEKSPSSYHSINLILFLGVLVAFMVLSGWLTDRPAARMVAVITLALHPLFSQTVENIAAQGVLLSLLATFSACCVMQLYRQRKLGLGWSVALITLLALVAIGSYEMGLLLPLWLAAIAGLTRVEQPVRPPLKQHSRRAPRPADEDEDEEDDGPLSPAAQVMAFGFPLFIVTGLYLYLRGQALGGLAPQPLAGLGAGFKIGPSIVTAYLFRLFWPVHPTYFYLLPESGAYLLLPALGWLVFLLLLALAVWACLRWRPLGLALILMLTPLIALAHFIPLTFFMSEQPLAFALPGFCLLLGALAGKAAVSAWSFPPQGWRDRALAGVLILVWFAMGWQVLARGQEWNTAETLWNKEANRHPGSATPLLEMLGNFARQGASGRQGATEAARSTARAARKIATPEELERVIEYEAVVAANIKDDDRLLELIKETLESKRPGSADFLSRMARLARTRDFISESIDIWRRELKDYPDSYDALYNLAEYEESKNNYQAALPLSRMAVTKASDRLLRANALELYGVILADTRQFDAALFNLGQALVLDKTLYRAYIYLARIYWGRKNYTMAETALKACYQFVGPRLSSYRDLAELETGLLESQNRANEAVYWMIQQMNQFPSDLPLQIFGARYLIEMGTLDKGLYDRALQTYQAIARMPGAPKADIAVGVGLIALRGKNDPAQARQIWNNVLQKLDPANAEAKRFLAELDADEAAMAKRRQAGGTTPAAGSPATPAATPTPAAAAPTPGATPAPAATPAPSASPAPAPLLSGNGFSLGNPMTPPAVPAAAPRLAPALTPAAR